MNLKFSSTNVNKAPTAVLSGFFIIGLASALMLSQLMVSAQESAPYSPELEQKITTRCPSIREYLSEQVRISELATRQNKVRGWEFLLRNLKSLQSKYESLGLDQTSLNSELSQLSSQLEQFKVDFEAYDVQMQQLINTDCRAQPELFWQRLQSARSFRTGISLSSHNYSQNIQRTIRDQQKLISSSSTQ